MKDVESIAKMDQHQAGKGDEVHAGEGFGPALEIAGGCWKGARWRSPAYSGKSVRWRVTKAHFGTCHQNKNAAQV